MPICARRSLNASSTGSDPSFGGADPCKLKKNTGIVIAISVFFHIRRKRYNDLPVGVAFLGAHLSHIFALLQAILCTMPDTGSSVSVLDDGRYEIPKAVKESYRWLLFHNFGIDKNIRFLKIKAQFKQPKQCCTEHRGTLTASQRRMKSLHRIAGRMRNIRNKAGLCRVSYRSHMPGFYFSQNPVCQPFGQQEVVQSLGRELPQNKN